MGTFSRKPMLKMADTNMKKPSSVLLSVTISGLDTPILCYGGGSKSIRNLKTTRNLYVFNIKTKESEYI